MNKKILPLFSSAALCVVLFALMMPSTAAAQNRYEGNYSYRTRQVGYIITRVEQSTNRFRNDLDQYLETSNQGGFGFRGYRINYVVRRFETAVNNLHSEFDSSDSWWETRSNVEEVLNAARPVSNWMRNSEFGSNVEMEWAYVRRDLNRLATAYNLPSV